MRMLGIVENKDCNISTYTKTLFNKERHDIPDWSEVVQCVVRRVSTSEDAKDVSCMLVFVNQTCPRITYDKICSTLRHKICFEQSIPSLARIVARMAFFTVILNVFPSASSSVKTALDNPSDRLSFPVLLFCAPTRCTSIISSPKRGMDRQKSL